MMKPPSFDKDHTKMTVPFIEHRPANIVGNKMIVKVDLRLKQPNQGDYISPAALHSIEHLLAQYMYRYKADQIIDVSPMGCRTGFYISYLKGTREEPMKIVTALEWALKQSLTPIPTEKNCGNYREHNLEEAKEVIREALRILKSEPTREYWNV